MHGILKLHWSMLLGRRSSTDVVVLYHAAWVAWGMWTQCWQQPARYQCIIPLQSRCFRYKQQKINFRPFNFHPQERICETSILLSRTYPHISHGWNFQVLFQNGGSSHHHRRTKSWPRLRIWTSTSQYSYYHCHCGSICLLWSCGCPDYRRVLLPQMRIVTKQKTWYRAVGS